MLTAERYKDRFEPHADYGFFGPGSVTWKVWSHPTTSLLGFQRATTIEQLDPNLVAAAEESGGVRGRTHTRYDRTLQYFSLVAFGATEPTTKAADILVKIHAKVIGVDPVTGGRYEANAPSSQLWIHMTAWHSVLYVYERFGPGPLSPREEEQYWAECARSAELQTIDPAAVPRSRDEVRAYFDQWRPRLSGSEAAQSMADYILHTEVVLSPDLPRWAKVAMTPFMRLVAKGTISTYPRHIRKMFGLRQSRMVDELVRWPLRGYVGLLHRHPRLMLAQLTVTSPSTIPTLAPVLLGIPAVSDVTMTPREAQRRYGYANPNDAHQDFRARQHQRVFGRGEKASDEGLIESQQLIGSI